MLMNIVNTEHFTIAVHPQKNRIYCTAKGSLQEIPEPLQAFKDWLAVQRHISGQFTVLLDATRETVQRQEIVTFLNFFYNNIGNVGLFKVAELLPDNAIVQMQHGRIAKMIGIDHKRKVFTDRGAAEAWLDASEDRKDSRIAPTQS